MCTWTRRLRWATSSARSNERRNGHSSPTRVRCVGTCAGPTLNTTVIFVIFYITRFARQISSPSYRDVVVPLPVLRTTRLKPHPSLSALRTLPGKSGSQASGEVHRSTAESRSSGTSERLAVRQHLQNHAPHLLVPLATSVTATRILFDLLVAELVRCVGCFPFVTFVAPVSGRHKFQLWLFVLVDLFRSGVSCCSHEIIQDTQTHTSSIVNNENEKKKKNGLKNKLHPSKLSELIICGTIALHVIFAATFVFGCTVVMSSMTSSQLTTSCG